MKATIVNVIGFVISESLRLILAFGAGPLLCASRRNGRSVDQFHESGGGAATWLPLPLSTK